MKLAILTSSRADYGIYTPLLHELKRNNIPFDIIAFGTHLSYLHGHTITQILNDGFEVRHRIETLVNGDSMESIATSMGLTVIKFASFWNTYGKEYDLVFCLGDRYEMNAAVVTGVHFGIRYAHLHGGETTLGATDNIFRHMITHASTIHFVSTESYRKRVAELIGEDKNIYNIGALSLDNIANITLLNKKEFKHKWKVDFSKPTVLITFHPETLFLERNKMYANELVKLITNNKSLQFLITMPNADVEGNMIRNTFITNLGDQSNVYMVENLGTQSYFSAIKHCSLMLGNTSSGIIEAASFNKYVIDLGERQKGRAHGENVFHSPIIFEKMNAQLHNLLEKESYYGHNIYWNGGATQRILEQINQLSKG